MCSKKFIKKFLSISTILFLIMGFFMYIMDPWLYYRIDSKNKYWLDGSFVSSGLIKNMDYDTAIIGSSYFQNFDMDWFREKLGWRPVNLTIPGLDNLETEMLTNRVIQEDKADRLVICLTYYNFDGGLNDKNRMPKYLFDNSPINDIEYLYSYEAWTKFLPLDLATKAIDKVFPAFSEKFSSMMDVDELGNKMQNFEYGKEIVQEQYKTISKDREIETDVEGAYRIMEENFSSYIKKLGIQKNPDKEFIFVLPPYSALYWYELGLENKLDYFQKFERMMVNELSKYTNVRIIDTQLMEKITDLNCYRDITHFNNSMQEEIVDYIKSEKYDLNKDNIENKQKTIRSIIREFEVENSNWLLVK